MNRNETTYWLARADEEALRAATSPVAATRRTHEAFETAYRNCAARVRDRGIVLGPPALHRGCNVITDAGE